MSSNGLLVRRSAIGLVIGLLFAAPLLLTQFQLTLLNYIGVYALVAWPRAADGHGRADLLRSGRLRRLRAYATPGSHAVRALAVARPDRVPRRHRHDRGDPGGCDAPTRRPFPAAEHDRLGHRDLLPVRQIPGLGGHDGISRVPAVTIGGFSFAPNAAMHYLVWAFVGGSAWLISNLLESREAAGRSARCAAAPSWSRAWASASSAPG